MGKETKIGLAIIGVLMTAFGVLLVRHFHVMQQTAQWEGQEQSSAEPLATDSDEKNSVVVAQADETAGSTNEGLWGTPGAASPAATGDAPARSYMPAEAPAVPPVDPYATRPAADDPYAATDDAASESAPAGQELSGGSPFEQGGFDDAATADNQGLAADGLDAPAQLPAEVGGPVPSEAPRANPLRRLSAEIPVEDADESPDARLAAPDGDGALPGSSGRYAFDDEPAMQSEVGGTGRPSAVAAPAADEDPFAGTSWDDPAQEEPAPLAAEDSLAPTDKLQPAPSARRAAPQPFADAAPQQRPADDWNSPGLVNGPTPARNEPLPVTNGRYTVQPNDTLWSISEKVYGSGRYFKALAEHNRSALPRSDKLAVGMQVAVPPVEELERNYPELCPRRRANTPAQSRAVRAAATLPAGDDDVYVVVEGDTLFDIARYELGKASRWAEIYELNRQALGEDFDYLQPGTKLRMPAKRRGVEAASGGGGSYLR